MCVVDGKKRGFAFISLSTHDSAQRIVSELKTVDQRPVAVDWAVDKDKYQNKIAAASVTVKSEPQTVDKVPGAKAKKVTSGGQTKDVKAETTSDQESDSENSDNDSDSNQSEEESDNDDDPESSESQSEGSDSEMDQSDGEEESGSEEEDSDEDDESESDEGFNETENKSMYCILKMLQNFICPQLMKPADSPNVFHMEINVDCIPCLGV